MSWRLQQDEMMEVAGYHEEDEVYSEYYNRKISDSDAEYIANKLGRHFKLGSVYVYFYGYCGSGRAYRFGRRLRLSHNPSIGLICHEVNHFLCWKIQSMKNLSRIRHGTKKWNRQLQRLLKYCKKKNFWEDELRRKNEPKPVKPEPTKNEIVTMKFLRLQKNLKRYESRIKFYTNKAKKTKRKLFRMHIEVPIGN